MQINWHRIIEEGQREPDGVRLKAKVVQDYKKGVSVELPTGHRTFIPYEHLEELCTPIAVACRQVGTAKEMLKPYWKDNNGGGQHESAPSE